MRSVSIGDRIFSPSNLGDFDEWEIESIEQPYDDSGNMLEPVVVLKMHCNAAWPLYRMTKQQKAERKRVPLFQYHHFSEKADYIPPSFETYSQDKADAERWRKLERLLSDRVNLELSGPPDPLDADWDEFRISYWTIGGTARYAGNTLSQAIDSIEE